ncbi:MAG: hypothetical protein IPI49_19710 [Myxococcales bacterium]|nr:hypothetical protein [Myxococcales bacterium]
MAKADCPTEDQETNEELDGKGRLHLGWFIGKGWLLEGLTSKLLLRDGTGAIRATRVPPLAGPDDPPANGRFWSFAFSPDGKQLAVIWRRHDFGPDVAREDDPRRDSVHIAEARDHRQCLGAGAACQWEYYLELWSLENPPKRGSSSKDWPKALWRERLTGAPHPGRPPTAKAPYGPLVFDAAGERLFVGFADGDVLVRSLPGHAPAADDGVPVGPLVSVHQLAVTKLSPSPDGRWMFSEDISAEQRVWQLPGR